MFFEIFRNIYSLGEMGGKLIYCGGHLEISKDHNSVYFYCINIIFCINKPNNDRNIFCSLCYLTFCVWKKWLWKNIFWGSNLLKILIFKSSQLSQISSNRAQILHGNVVWGALVFMFFEIFRKKYSLGDIGGKRIFAAAILDFGGHLGFSNWPHMIFIIISWFSL